jgi:hypothetical protein
VNASANSVNTLHASPLYFNTTLIVGGEGTRSGIRGLATQNPVRSAAAANPGSFSPTEFHQGLIKGARLPPPSQESFFTESHHDGSSSDDFSGPRCANEHDQNFGSLFTVATASNGDRRNAPPASVAETNEREPQDVSLLEMLLRFNTMFKARTDDESILSTAATRTLGLQADLEKIGGKDDSNQRRVKNRKSPKV